MSEAVAGLGRDLAAEYPHQTLLLDTNLWILYLVGLLSEKLVERHKRTARYSTYDFIFLQAMLTSFGDKIIFTPHIMTEVTNILNISTWTGKYLYQFPILIQNITHQLTEKTVAFSNVCQHFLFPQLGTTDTTLFILSETHSDLVIATDDLPLIKQLDAWERPVIQFNWVHNFLNEPF